MDLLLPLQVLPLAIGAAISPSVLMVVILVLASGPEGLRRAWALAIGLTAALIVLGWAGYRLLSLLPDVRSGVTSREEFVVALVAGLLLLVLAYREHRRPTVPRQHSDRASRFTSLPPWVLIPVGFAWQFTEFNTLVLYLPALHLITSASAALVVQVVAVVVLVTVTSITWLGPPLYVTVRGAPAQERLDRLHDWLSGHSHDITMGTCAVFGVGLLVWAAAIAVSLM